MRSVCASNEDNFTKAQKVLKTTLGYQSAHLPTLLSGTRWVNQKHLGSLSLRLHFYWTISYFHTNLNIHSLLKLMQGEIDFFSCSRVLLSLDTGLVVSRMPNASSTGWHGPWLRLLFWNRILVKTIAVEVLPSPSSYVRRLGWQWLGTKSRL